MASDFLAGWQTLTSQVPIHQLYSAETLDLSSPPDQSYALLPGKSALIGDVTVQLIGTENPIVRLSDRQSWLVLPQLSEELQTHLANAGDLLNSQVLIWPGQAISPDLLAAINPAIAICYGYHLPRSVERELQKAQIKVFWTDRDGAVMWHPRRGFHGYLETNHRIVSPWG